MTTPIPHNGRKPNTTASPATTEPAKYTYALKAWSVERRSDGWFVAPTVPAFTGNRTEWRGPFETIESACLAIARGLAVEIADRHTRSIETHKIPRTHALYGFKPETRLKGRNGTIV